MRIRNIILWLSVILLCIGLFACEKNRIDHKTIKGKWKTVSDVKDSKILFTIADSTILTEFYWDNGIKKVMLYYKIREKKRNYLLIETKNTFGLIKADTFVMENSYLRINTSLGKTLILEKMQ